MDKDLSIYHKKRNNIDEYIISKPKANNASDFFLFVPSRKSIESIVDALDYIKNNMDLKKIDTLPNNHRLILVEVLQSIKRSQLLEAVDEFDHDINKDEYYKK